MNEPSSRVVLFAPVQMPQALEWKRAICAGGSRCRLISLHGRAPTAEPDVLAFRGFLGRARGLLALWRESRPERCDVVLAYYLTSYGAIAGLLCPHRYVAVAAGSDIFPARYGRLRTWLARFAVARAAGAIAWTPEMAGKLIELGASSDRIAISPRGIDLETFRPADLSPRDVDEPLRVVSTRRLRPLFRIDRLLHGVRRALDSGAAIELEIVGDGTEGPELRALATELRLDAHVRFSGSLPPVEVAKSVRRADVFVSLSRSDGLSTSLAEALACGAFPVVSDIPANTRFIRNGVNGAVVNGDDVEAIAGALLQAWRNRGALGAARRHNIDYATEHFDIRRNSERLLSLAQSWIAIGHSTGRPS